MKQVTKKKLFEAAVAGGVGTLCLTAGAQGDWLSIGKNVAEIVALVAQILGVTGIVVAAVKLVAVVLELIKQIKARMQKQKALQISQEPVVDQRQSSNNKSVTSALARTAAAKDLANEAASKTQKNSRASIKTPTRQSAEYN